ncbi:MAG: hypothetical protein BWY30_00399 [Tenericutes bacterium ADurb.Bin239]|jgi:CxxC motif-containing protein|nr:MAG: hypothetical protein BWY30_00399 [Tenericutes bacterium ADurb.Bin239]
MSSDKKVTCLVCPRGCIMTVTSDLKVSGNFCARGIPYALQEVKEPKRNLTYVVKVEGHEVPLPVRTEQMIAKHLIPAVVNELRKIVVKAPIEFNSIIVENILDSGVNIISSAEVK